MLKVGITGGIGSGKSTVAKVFETLGIPVYYADDAARRLMSEDKDLIASITRHFGKESYTGGILNRAHIANIVFNNPDQLLLLNSLTHPATIDDANRWMQLQHAPYIIKEAALVFESGSAEFLDYVIGVYAPAALRIKRTMDRDKISRKDVQSRMNRQIDEEMKMKLCDAVITNDEQSLLVPQVIRLHEFLLTKNG